MVTAGQPTAPVTLDVYEDYLCPYCERLETRSGGDITTALNEGKVKVNYHALNILDARTTPPGYSTLAANAALCAVPAGIWPAFHARLFAEQPAEGSAGLTAAQLTQIGTELGAGQGFGACVEANGKRPPSAPPPRRPSPTRACRPTASSAPRPSRSAAARSTSRRPTGCRRCSRGGDRAPVVAGFGVVAEFVRSSQRPPTLRGRHEPCDVQGALRGRR